MINQTIYQSFFIHLALVSLFFLLTLNNKQKEIKKFNFSIIEKKAIPLKKQTPKIVINGAKSVSSKDIAKKKLKKVFGVKRKTLTSEKGTVVAKIGNTLTKKEDRKVLKDDESDSLPVPSEEFLVTSMPRPIKEIRPSYPTWAKEKKISGRVIFDILIDDKGNVRKASLRKGLHPELDKLARQAILKFKFKPAYIDKKPVAVKIQYAIKFILES